MSGAVLAMLSPESKSAATKTSSRTLRVSEPGDSLEREADKVADTVASGGRIPSWSLSSSGAGLIQRDTNTTAAQPSQPPVRMIGDPQNPAAANNYGDMLGKLAEALLKTEAGKTIAKYLEDQPIVKDVGDFVETPAGIAVVGGTAIAAIGGLAAAGEGLPAQLPDIPLDKLLPGLSVKVDIEGPLNRPTQGSLMFTFGAAPPKKKKGSPTASEKYRAQTARIAEDLKFGAGVDPSQLGPVPSAEARRRQAEEKAVESYELRKMGAILRPGATQTPGQFTPLVPGTQPKSLGMRDNASRSDATSKPGNAAKDDQSKKEEIPVQRKAERAIDHQPDVTSEVESIITSSGRPLDRETRRAMEARIGFDFSKVRIHTDARAAASAKALGARAYTVGKNVVFAAGRFAPNSTEGKRLLAHELTHVVQQTQALHAPSARLIVIAPAPVQIQRDLDEDAKTLSGWDVVRHPLESLQKVSAKIPGYTLFTVIIGYDPIQRKDVVRNAANLVGEFLKLVGAEETFKNLKESQALEQAFSWLQGEIASLGFSVEMFKDLATQAAKTAVNEIVHGVGAMLKSVYALFEPAFQKAKTFARNVLKKVGEFLFAGALKLVGGTGVLEILRDAGDVISAIIQDPLRFVGNLVKALRQGVGQFADKILDYLKEGVMTWLFGKIGQVDFPKKITPGSLFNLVLDVLGLNYKTFRKELVTELGGEQAVVAVEKGFEILQTIVTKGFGAAWQKILETAGNVLDSLLSAAKDWAITKVVTIAVTQLVKLVNPAGAVIAAIQAIYSTLKVFIDKAKQIAEIIKAISSSISKIVANNLGDAANSVEKAMGNTVPIVIGFLADFLGLGDVADTVRRILDSVKAKIALGVRKFVAYIVKVGRGILAKGKETVAGVFDWWRQRKEVTEGDEKHSIYLEGTEDQTKLMIASVPGITWSDFLDAKLKTATPAQKSTITDLKPLVDKLEKRLPPSKDDAEKSKNVEEKRVLFDDVAAKITTLGLHHDATDPAAVINYLPVRSEDDGGQGAVASVLPPSHPQGSEPNDEPAIWTSLGGLIQKKKYKQGHLLNHNLGGEGRRFNLSPINTKANSDHLNMVEKTVKKAVNLDKKIVSYRVDVDYGTHPSKPQRMQQLEKTAATTKLGPEEEAELKEFQAEQRLCTGFKFELRELEHNGKEWVPKKNPPPEYNGEVKNQLAL